MARPGFPLPLRNALATLACDGLEDDEARTALAWLADPTTPPSDPAAGRLAAVHLIDPGGRELLDVHVPWAAAIRAHAVRAGRAAAAHRSRGPRRTDAVERALVEAAALWEEGLFFEVHEVLEAVWQREAGDRRQALQGLIQVAVAWHHLAHGNPRGARTLLREGRARLAAAPAGILPSVDTGALLADTALAEATLDSAGEPPALTPPHLILRF
jgi:hypothetical protein